MARQEQGMSEARPAGLALRALASAAHAVTAMLEPAALGADLPRVNATRDPIFPGDPHAASFEAMLRLVASCFTVIPLHEAVQGLERGTLPRGALAITFDDGYADNATVALPILARLGLPATFFVAAGFIDGGRMFNDVVIESVRAFAGTQCDLGPWGRHDVATPAQKAATIAALIAASSTSRPRRATTPSRTSPIASRCRDRPSLMMTSAQVRALSSAGMDVGGHTLTHPILARIPGGRCEREIAAGREALEGLTRAPGAHVRVSERHAARRLRRGACRDRPAPRFLRCVLHRRRRRASRRRLLSGPAVHAVGRRRLEVRPAAAAQPLAHGVRDGLKGEPRSAPTARARHPQLEHHQDPDHLAVVRRLARHELVQQPRDEASRRDAALDAALERVAREIAQRWMTRHPRSERQSEAVLLLGDDLRRQQVAQRLP
jgi:peptidoglycan/xylan/chitin deacetylase (PgdA/CDA1 family)